MIEQNERDKPRSRVKKGSNSFLYVAIVVVILLGVGFYFYSQKTIHSPGTTTADNPNVSQEPNETTPASSLLNPSGQTTDSTHPQSTGEAQSIQDGAVSQEKEGGTFSTASPLEKDDSTQIEHKPSGTDEYQNLVGELNVFYTHLDQQPYMQAFKLKEPSKVHFSKLLQKLVDNPPVVTQETDDLFTLLKNTAHFFRILGKDNIIILKGILDREKESFEKTLKNFYTLTYHPEYLKKEYSLTIPFDALYDYAGFFLNTMGGRLYLFRRDSTSRLAVSYYAILVVDRANDEGSSHHGIDLRPAIDSLIEEIENGGKRLRLKEEYLDKLYDLQEKYN